MFRKKKYVYFVTFFGCQSASVEVRGCTEVTTTAKITTFEDIKAVLKVVTAQQGNGVKDIILTSFPYLMRVDNVKRGK